MAEPAAVHPMRAAMRDGRVVEWAWIACAAWLPALGLHLSDTLALAAAGLFLVTPKPWRHQ